MKILIEIDGELYDKMRRDEVIISGMRGGKTVLATVYNAVVNGVLLPALTDVEHTVGGWTIAEDGGETMPSCRVILKKLMRDKRITVDEYDKLLRNLKPQITKEDAIDYLHQIRWMQAHDKEIFHSGYERGKNERKTGKWIIKQRGNATDMCCSNCGAVRIKELSWGYPAEEVEKGLYNGDIEFIPYCERCGVKMEASE